MEVHQRRGKGAEPRWGRGHGIIGKAALAVRRAFAQGTRGGKARRGVGTPSWSRASVVAGLDDGGECES
eukprot:COSAG06_NODE_44689_length_361_cov_0.923664_1_plen_68_part_01